MTAPVWISSRKAMVAAPTLVGVGVVVIFTLVANWDTLFGQMLIGMDTATAFYPWYSFLGEQLRNGRGPGWNPHTFLGTPFAADPESRWTHLPAMMAFTVLPLERAGRRVRFLQTA